jgi:hypothetical protein
MQTDDTNTDLNTDQLSDAREESTATTEPTTLMDVEIVDVSDDSVQNNNTMTHDHTNDNNSRCVSSDHMDTQHETQYDGGHEETKESGLPDTYYNDLRQNYMARHRDINRDFVLHTIKKRLALRRPVGEDLQRSLASNKSLRLFVHQHEVTLIDRLTRIVEMYVTSQAEM